MQHSGFGILKHLAGISSLLRHFWAWFLPHLIRQEKSDRYSTFHHPELLPQLLTEAFDSLILDHYCNNISSFIYRWECTSTLPVFWAEQRPLGWARPEDTEVADRPQKEALFCFTIAKAGFTAATTVWWGRANCNRDPTMTSCRNRGNKLHMRRRPLVGDLRSSMFRFSYMLSS